MRVPITNQFQVVMYLQAAINIKSISSCHVFTNCYKHFFSSCIHICFVLTFVLTCIDICFQDVIYKLLHVVSTSCYKHFFSS